MLIFVPLFSQCFSIWTVVFFDSINCLFCVGNTWARSLKVKLRGNCVGWDHTAKREPVCELVGLRVIPQLLFTDHSLWIKTSISDMCPRSDFIRINISSPRSLPPYNNNATLYFERWGRLFNHVISKMWFRDNVLIDTSNSPYVYQINTNPWNYTVPTVLFTRLNCTIKYRMAIPTSLGFWHYST